MHFMYTDKKNNEIMHRTIDNQRARQLQAIIISNIKPHMAGTHRRNFARRYTQSFISVAFYVQRQNKKKQNKIEDMYNSKKLPHTKTLHPMKPTCCKEKIKSH